MSTSPTVPVTRGSLADVVALLSGLRLTVLTGAGVSTDSGIPDYRGPDSPPRTPMTFQQFVGDEAFRRHYWARNHVGWRHVHRTVPNAGHRALAAMEQRGVVLGLITQNVDLLHEAAGSRHVIDLHGRYDRVVCLRCHRVVPRTALAERLEALNPGFVERMGQIADVEIAPDADAVVEQTADFRVQACWQPDPDDPSRGCGGILKPDIVYFGENVPRERVERAYAMVDAADALLVAGSSLTVHSGRRFVRHAARSGRPVVVVNRGATRGDVYATLTLDAGTSETLTQLADLLPPLPH
ncbi:Sir2 family NAD-dependent protein deacetylase [Cellulomonas dongxiuzhuiae]|uniref:NAD-dependent protein deacetylase n=1 Tax=Cellulomonas dongxiuzhuiae TaxID=2819979 RepID=A0ABX8GK20_9CELL|nr:Sir2 family NAD-dependent protein deacetylase [Cellulomonas dongxiuzhuiae]MBO3095551.1 NAD-dependent deacetylase [Cellulomonas dongxiuzhuiae]QWC16523.1 NAD-dependent deacetylase [Cellulomonas dongxiuzhuiae]